MSVYSGPEISSDGLVLSLDAANIRSYNPNLVTTLGAFNYPIGGTVSLDLAPDNTTVLCKHTLTGVSSPFMNTRVDRTITPGTYTISGWFKGTTAFAAAFAFVGETTSEIPATTINITTAWQRFSFTFNLTAAQTASRVQLFFGTQGNDKIVSIWGIELISGSTTTPNYIVSNSRGNSWTDLAGNGNNGTLSSIIVYTSSNNGSLVFNGTSQFVSFSSGAVTGNSPRSMFCWMKSTSGGCFVSTGTASASQAFNLVTYGSSRVGVMGFNYDFYPSTGATVLNNNWHYIGATFDGTTLITYVDGVLDNTSAGRNYSTTGQNNFIGKSHHVGSESYINGSIPAVQIYNRALTATEVRLNFNALRGRFGI